VKKIKEYLLGGHHPGQVGIEIECEGNGMRIVDNNTWTTEDDGSLRGPYPESRAEFILKRPIHGKDVQAAVALLVKELEGAEFNFSFRTSVHIHINCQELNQLQCARFVYCYLLLEDILMDKVGPGRKNNRFCLRHEDAEGMETVIRALGSPDWYVHMHADHFKYSSVNVCPLSKYGSIEFRAMEGNIDKERIHQWANVLLNIRNFSLKFDKINQIMEFVRVNGATAYAREAMGDMYEYFYSESTVNKVLRAASLTIDIPFTLTKSEKALEVKEKNKKGVVTGGGPKPQFLFDEMVGVPVNGAEIHGVNVREELLRMQHHQLEAAIRRARQEVAQNALHAPQPVIDPDLEF
jgi:Putative amidoligase enzyme